MSELTAPLERPQYEANRLGVVVTSISGDIDPVEEYAAAEVETQPRRDHEDP
jgi:hypothetical protein